MAKFNPDFFKRISKKEIKDELSEFPSADDEAKVFQLIPDFYLKKQKLYDSWNREGGNSLYSSLKDFVEYKANCGSIWGYGDFFVWLFNDDKFYDSRPWNLPVKYKEAYLHFVDILSESSEDCCSAEEYYNNFISHTWEYADDIRLGVVGSASEEWEHDSMNTPPSKLKETFIFGMKECANLLEQSGYYQGAKTAKTIREILNKTSDIQCVLTNNESSSSPFNPTKSYNFAGKTLEELDLRGCSDLISYLIANKNSPMIKGRHGIEGKEDVYGVFEALQSAEESGRPIDQQAVLDILQSDMPSRERLNAAIIEIIGCNSDK